MAIRPRREEKVAAWIHRFQRGATWCNGWAPLMMHKNWIKMVILYDNKVQNITKIFQPLSDCMLRTFLIYLNLIVSGASLRKKSHHVVLSWCVLPALDPAISSIVAKVVPAAASRSSVFATQMPWLPCYVCGFKVVHLWTCLGGPSWEEGWHGYHGWRLPLFLAMKRWIDVLDESTVSPLDADASLSIATIAPNRLLKHLWPWRA